MKKQPAEFFCFNIDNQSFAIPLLTVERVLMATEVLEVPESPSVIHGIIDYLGMIIPVINLRYRLKLSLFPVRISDIFIIAETTKRKIAMVADSANGVIVPVETDLVSAEDVDSGFKSEGMIRRDDGILLIYDIEKFLSEEDEIQIQIAIDKQSQDNK
jgi:purine-binding chemotaxis protein CheW